MAAFSKSYGTLFALASTAASSVAISSALDVSTALGGMLYARFGRRAVTAAGAGANLRFEASHAASGDNSWFPFAELASTFAAVEGEAVTGTVVAGQNVVTVASTTNLAAGDLIYIDNTTIANSEWGRIKSIVANTSVTLEDNLVNAQTGSTLYDAAEIYAPIAIPDSVARIRFVNDSSLFTQANACEVRYTLITGIA